MQLKLGVFRAKTAGDIQAREIGQASLECRERLRRQSAESHGDGKWQQDRLETCFIYQDPPLAFLTSFIGSWGSKLEVRKFPRSSFKNVLFNSMLSYLTPLCPAAPRKYQE